MEPERKLAITRELINNTEEQLFRLGLAHRMNESAGLADPDLELSIDRMSKGLVTLQDVAEGLEEEIDQPKGPAKLRLSAD